MVEAGVVTEYLVTGERKTFKETMGRTPTAGRRVPGVSSGHVAYPPSMSTRTKKSATRALRNARRPRWVVRWAPLSVMITGRGFGARGSSRV